jgi:Flp pilus assembly protein TadD
MAYINMGILLLERPEPRVGDARLYLEEAVRLEPANAEAQVNLGAALRRWAGWTRRRTSIGRRCG